MIKIQRHRGDLMKEKQKNLEAIRESKDTVFRQFFRIPKNSAQLHIFELHLNRKKLDPRSFDQGSFFISKRSQRQLYQPKRA